MRLLCDYHETSDFGLILGRFTNLGRGFPKFDPIAGSHRRASEPCEPACFGGIIAGVILSTALLAFALTLCARTFSKRHTDEARESEQPFILHADVTAKPGVWLPQSQPSTDETPPWIQINSTPAPNPQSCRLNGEHECDAADNPGSCDVNGEHECDAADGTHSPPTDNNSDPPWTGYFGEAVRPPRPSSVNVARRHRPPPLHASPATLPQAPAIWHPAEPQIARVTTVVRAPSPWYSVSMPVNGTPTYSLPLSAAPLWTETPAWPTRTPGPQQFPSAAPSGWTRPGTPIYYEVTR